LQSGGEVYRTPLAVQTLELDRYPLAPDCGLPLGSYLSQWCGTFYLDGLDHFVKRELKVEGYLRYMDDFALFGDDIAALLTARQHIADWLTRKRRLQLNPKRWHIVPTTAPGVFLGYRVSRSSLGPSRKLRRSMQRRLRLAAERGHEPLVRSMQSYRGLLLF
jgi:Reverse transcriptase (RNA-dependent DNA polymerase)